MTPGGWCRTHGAKLVMTRQPPVSEYRCPRAVRTVETTMAGDVVRWVCKAPRKSRREPEKVES